MKTKKIFYKDEGFKLNEVFVQKDLAKTLSRIASYGYRDFYEGQISKKIIKCMNRTGGIISYNDLKNYMPVERNPIVFNYRDNKVVQYNAIIPILIEAIKDLYELIEKKNA